MCIAICAMGYILIFRTYTCTEQVVKKTRWPQKTESLVDCFSSFLITFNRAREKLELYEIKRNLFELRAGSI